MTSSCRALRAFGLRRIREGSGAEPSETIGTPAGRLGTEQGPSRAIGIGAELLSFVVAGETDPAVLVEAVCLRVARRQVNQPSDGVGRGRSHGREGYARGTSSQGAAGGPGTGIGACHQDTKTQSRVRMEMCCVRLAVEAVGALARVTSFQLAVCSSRRRTCNTLMAHGRTSVCVL